MLVDTGRSQCLKVLTSQVAVEAYDMLLFTNNYTVVEATTLGDLSEVAVTGYTRQTLSGFAMPTGPIAGVWSSLANNVTFSNTSGGDATIYGWAYVGHTTGVLYGGGNFGAALTLLAGGTLVFSPGFSDNTL